MELLKKKSDIFDKVTSVIYSAIFIGKVKLYKYSIFSATIRLAICKINHQYWKSLILCSNICNTTITVIWIFHGISAFYHLARAQISLRGNYTFVQHSNRQRNNERLNITDINCLRTTVRRHSRGSRWKYVHKLIYTDSTVINFHFWHFKSHRIYIHTYVYSNHTATFITEAFVKKKKKKETKEWIKERKEKGTRAKSCILAVCGNAI